MPSSAPAYQPHNINHLDKLLSLSLSLSRAASQALNPLGVMTGRALLFQPSNTSFFNMGVEAQLDRTDLVFFFLIKAVYSYMLAEQRYSEVIRVEATLVGPAPGRVGDDSFWLIMFN